MGQLCSCFSEEPQQQQQPQQPQRQPQQQQASQPQQNAYPGAAAQKPQPSPAPAGSSQYHQSGPPASQQSHHAGGHAPFAAASTAGDAARFRASEHAHLRGEYFKQSQEAYQRGDGAAAKTLSEKGKAEGRLMEQANAEAAAAYFAGNNAKHDMGTIDLHGLYVEEAIQKLEERLTVMLRKNMPTLVVIVGRGNHSKDGVRKIEPAVQKLIAEHRLRVVVGVPNAGCLTLHLNSNEAQGFYDMNGSHGGRGKGSSTEQACLQQ